MPDLRAFLFRVSDFSQIANSHWYLENYCTYSRKLDFGLKDAEYRVSYMCLIHLYGLNAIEIETKAKSW